MPPMINLEGKQCVTAALQARQRRIQVVLLKHDLAATKAQEILDLAAAANVPVRRVDVSEIKAMAHSHSHGGVIAVAFPKPRLTPGDLLERVRGLSEPALLLMLEGVDDARNLGFTLRTAESVGVHAVLVKKHLWDFDETEIARASSGALERIALVQFEGTELLKDLKKFGVRIYGCLAGARRTVFDVNLSKAVMLCIGGEKRGLSGATRQLCDRFITIPSVGGASSLSLSHAGAIVMGEALRQRTKKARLALAASRAAQE